MQSLRLRSDSGLNLETLGERRIFIRPPSLWARRLHAKQCSKPSSSGHPSNACGSGAFPSASYQIQGKASTL